jgi:hypothetical protein
MSQGCLPIRSLVLQRRMPLLITETETEIYLNPVFIYFLSVWMVIKDKHSVSEAFGYMWVFLKSILI